MQLYIKSEILKTKRTKVRKMLWMVPMIGTTLAIGFSLLGGPDIIRLSVETIINHWGIIWLSVLIALITGLLNNLEKKSTNYKMVIGHPINLHSKELGRILFVTGLVGISSLLLVGVIVGVRLSLQSSSYLAPMSACILAVIVMFVTSLWQIPLCLWLSRKTNLFLTLLLNGMLNLNLGTFFAATKEWWIIPYCWHLRAHMPLIKMHSNGIPLPKESELLSYSVIPVSIALSVFLFIILTFVTCRSFNKLEVKS